MNKFIMTIQHRAAEATQYRTDVSDDPKGLCELGTMSRKNTYEDVDDLDEEQVPDHSKNDNDDDRPEKCKKHGKHHRFDDSEPEEPSDHNKRDAGKRRHCAKQRNRWVEPDD